MKKTCVFLAGILVIFIAYACEMPWPSSIELKSDRFEMNAPVKLGRFNLASILSELIKDSLPEGFEMYDMVNYSNAQAFLIAYQMDLMESFNPDDYLKDLNRPEGIKPIYPDPIVIPKMTSDTISQDKWFYFDMHAFFEDMQEKINTDSTPETRISLAAVHNKETVEVDIPSDAVFPSFMVFKQDGSENFNAVFVHEGEIEVEISLEFDGNYSPTELAALEITLHDIEMTGPDYRNTPDPKTVELKYEEGHKATITIDIGDAEIEKDSPPQFSIRSIASVYNDYSGTTKTFSFKLVMQPTISSIKLRGARDLKIGRMEKPLPPDIVHNISMGSVDNMLNADIAEGEFRIDANPPPYVEGSDKTGCEGLFIGYEIVMEQQSVWLGAEEFKGLNCTLAKDDPSQGNPSLAGESISGRDLIVNEWLSKIIIKADPINGATFELFNDKDANGNNVYEVQPYEMKVLPIKLDMGMTIEELEVVRWKGSVLPSIDVPEINFANMGEQNVSFIQSITFSEIKLNVDFTVPAPPPDPPPGHVKLTPGSGLPKELEGHIALKVTCPELGFEVGDPAHTQILQDGENIFTSEGTTLDIHGSDDKVKKIKFDVELIPVIGETPMPDSQYMEFGPVSGAEEIRMNIYAQVTVDFDWEEAVIDLKAALRLTDSEEALRGTFPQNAGDGTRNEVNLSEYGKYMSGIKFSANLKAKIFLSGPDVIVDHFKPDLNFNAQWGVDDPSPPPPVSMVKKDQKLEAGDVLPALPGQDSRGEWVYPGTALPTAPGLELTGFDEIIAAFPRDLRFNYEMVLGEEGIITVEHHNFDDREDSKIRALLVLLLPLELEAGEQGGLFAIPGNIFGGKEGENGEFIPVDLFGRTVEGEDSRFTDVNIKSLGIKFDFGYPLFAGSRLHFDKGDKDGKNKLFGEDGLPLGDGNSLNIILTSEQRKFINEHLIYPDIQFVFPPGKKMQIARNLLPVRIVIAASGSYTLDLDKYLGSD